MIDALPVEYLREILNYDAETGNLTWRELDVSKFRDNRSYGSYKCQCAGKIIASKGAQGYLRLSINCRRHYAHRVAWAIHYGEWPKGQIDHINGVRDDNRIENLRDVSIADNSRNQKTKKNNKSGVTGVFWSDATNKWHANIGIDGKQSYIGIFDNIDDAIFARKAAEKRLGYHKNHGRKP